MKISKQFLDAVLPERMRGKQTDNVYVPRIQSTVYPSGTKRMSLDGSSEWYGLQEGTINKQIKNK